MSYEMMENLLVQRIAEIRLSEENLLKHLGGSSRASGLDLTAEYRTLQSKMGEVETLLSAMDSAASVHIPQVDSYRSIACV